MRKIIVLISILSLIVLLVGCNDIKPSTEDITLPPSETNEPTSASNSDETNEPTSASNSDETNTHITENNDTTEETSVGAVDDGNELLSPYSGYVDGVVCLEGTFSENYFYYVSALLESKWEYNRPAVMYHLAREMNLTREDFEVYYAALGCENVPENIYAGLLAETLEESMQFLKTEYAFYNDGKLYTVYDIYKLDNENALPFNIDDNIYDSVWQSIDTYLKTPTAVDVGDAMRAYVSQKADTAK